MSGNEKMEVEYIANDQGVLKLIERQTKMLDGLEKRLEKLGTTSEKSAKAAAGSFDALEKELKQNEAALKGLVIGSKEFDLQRQKVDKLRESLTKAKKEIGAVKPDKSTWSTVSKSMMGAGAAAAVLYAALKKVADVQREVIEGASQEVVALDTMARLMQIQTGLTDPERKIASRDIIEQSSDAGVKAEVGFQAATQLAGSAFVDPIESGSLKTILDTIQAGSFKGSADELVQAFSQMMNAMGIEKTNANLKEIAVATQNLFKQTDFQLTDLSEFAKIGATVKGANIAPAEGIAAFTALRDSLPAGESSTGLRNLITKFQKGEVTKEGKQDLERIGVKAEDVDFVGEDLRTVLTTVKTAVDKLPEAQRNAALGKLFGTENVTSARMLMNSVPRIQELMDAQGNAAQFEVDRQTAAGSMQAQLNRVDNQRLVERIPIADKIFDAQLARQQRDDQDKMRVEQAAVSGVPGKALAVQTVATVNNVVEDSVGIDRFLTRAVSLGLKEARPAVDVQRETNRLLKELLAQQRAERTAQQAPPQQPQQRQQQPPAGRPRQAPLPQATAP